MHTVYSAVSFSVLLQYNFCDTLIFLVHVLHTFYFKATLQFEHYSHTRREWVCTRLIGGEKKRERLQILELSRYASNKVDVLTIKLQTSKNSMLSSPHHVPSRFNHNKISLSPTFSSYQLKTFFEHVFQLKLIHLFDWVFVSNITVNIHRCMQCSNYGGKGGR